MLRSYDTSARCARAARAVAVVIASGACVLPPPPRPQVLIVVDTDVTVPDALDDTTETDADAALPIADFARVEVLLRGTNTVACENCRRDLPLERGRLERHEVSFGVIALDQPADVRVRVFRLDRVVSGGEPGAGAAIDVRAKLATSTDGVVTQNVVALGDRFGIPTSPDVTDEPNVGPPDVSRVGTWEGARERPCTVTPRPDGPLHDGERCVPGGAFYRGLARLPIYADRYHGPLDASRVAIVSPVLMDRYEYTVGRFKRDGLPPGADPPFTWSDSELRDTWRKRCPLGSPGKSEDIDALPLGCVSWATAKALCEQAGGRLPTETEYEWEATGRGQERLYPWGSASPYAAPPVAPGDPPGPCCDSVIFGRYAEGETGGVDIYPSECAGTDPPPFGGPRVANSVAVDFVERAPQPGGCAAARDVSRDGIIGLAGNVQEWVADYFAISADPCWVSPALRRDPVCDTPGKVIHPWIAQHTAVGNVWWSVSAWLFSRVRNDIDATSKITTLGIGFRCVRSGVER